MLISKKKILVIIIIIPFIFLLSKYILIKQEFSNYLYDKYPETSFSIGMIKYDPIYARIYAKVKAGNDIEFMIDKPTGSNRIFEEYLRNKYEKEVIIQIEKYLGEDLLKDIGNIRCYINEEKISYPNYDVDDLLANIEHLSIDLSNSLKNFEEFYYISSKVFDKFNYNSIEANERINVYTYTSDHLDCSLLKENSSYVLRVMVVAEEITTKEEYYQKRTEIQQIIDKSKFKLSRAKISYKGDLK